MKGLLLLVLLPLIFAQNLPTSVRHQLPVNGGITWVQRSTGYAVLNNGSVALTQDNGKTFNLLNIPSGNRIESIFTSIYDIENNGQVFLLGNVFAKASSYWATGASLIQVNLPVGVNEIKLHPTDNNYFLGLNRPGQWGPSQLHLFTDKGLSGTPTQVVVRSDVWNFFWCFAGLGKISPGRMCAVSDLSVSKQQRLLISDNYGSSWSTAVDDVILGFVEHFFYLFACSATGTLYVSSNNGTTWNPARFPENNRLYNIQPENILDARRGAVWISGHTGAWEYGVARPGNLYISNGDGLSYDLVASNINSLNNWWDFAYEQALEGFYFVNVIMGDEIVDNNIVAKTMLSWNNGKDWRFLNPPALDINGNKYPCNTSNTFLCSLNLFGETTYLGLGGSGFYGGIYTDRAVAGLVIGTGNVGFSLATDYQSVGTYLSYDAGFSWEQVFDYPTVSAYGDNGGIFVFVKNQRPTNVLYYSTSIASPIKAEQFIFSPDEQVIVNSVYSRNFTGKIFQVKASNLNGSLIYFTIDFSSLGLPACSNNDYEPYAPGTGDCILGRKVVFRRRKAAANCFSDDSFDPISSITNCACTREDYECDVGFEKGAYGNCTGSFPDPYTIGLCSGTDYYNKSQGYRRIPQDSCYTTLNNLEPVRTKCPPRGIAEDIEQGLSKGGIVGLMFAFIILVGVAAFIGGVAAGHRSSFVREKMPKSWVSTESHRLLS